MSVPPRWMNCPRKSKIIAEKFLAFKTPLGLRYDAEIPEANRFQLPMLFAYLQSLKVKLGLIIDLTNTNRFYDKAEVENSGIGHVKLRCLGRGETPTKEQVNTFIGICDKYFDQNPGQLIGVHCTHGFNRSGFLIIAYLIERDDWSVEAAVRCFAQCRSPGIYKPHYLHELVSRYGDLREAIAPPELPDWCLDEEDDLSDSEYQNGQTAEDGSRPDGSRKRFKRDPRLKEAKFFDDIDGVEVVQSPKREEIQQLCQKMCSWDSGGFPGSQPVSMDVQNIKLLHEKPYRVKREVYLIDRDNNVFAAPQLHFPQRKFLKEHVYETLLEGEMVLDKENERSYPRYLVYDIVIFQGQEVGKQSHEIRMLCIEKEIEMARSLAAQQGLFDKSTEPFSIRAKKFFSLEKTKWVLDHWSPKLSHENDGLIFNPAEEPYAGGQSPEVLKWKPHTLNSVTKELKNLNKKVVECTWDSETKQWKFLRVREDKSFPNGYNTAISVCQSIQQPVTRQWLLEVVEKHRFKQNRHRTSNSASKSQSM
ncbi:mRNA-capping enzyme [Acropora cervicornis]|uniref:mRNA-capping enzyme n=1 Tax=Acropora cervicornis TaxID=6130 RepID=A0AAD9V3V5_ACRCE|nr:mRNA-capping enzyme [Acropora cervicornis]